MTVRDELVDLVSTVGASMVVLDPRSATSVPLPPSLGLAAEIVDAVAPLELLDPASQSAAVIGFERARRTGESSVVVRIAGSSRPLWLRLFDLSDEHGVVVGVMTPAVDEPDAAPESNALPVRCASAQLSLGGVVESVDPAFVELFGWTADDVVGESLLTIVHPDDHESSLVAWAEVLVPSGGSARLRQRLRCRDGSWLWCEVTDVRDDTDGDRSFVVSEIIDVSREIEAHAALQRRETMLDRLYRALPTSVVVLELDGTVAVENERWPDLFGTHELGAFHAMLDRCANSDRIIGALERAAASLDDVDLSIDLDDGSCRHADLHIRPLVEGGVHVGTLLTVDETTVQRHHADDIAEQMRRDPMTGAQNRLGVREHIEHRIASQQPLAVLYIDLDDFKVVNDTHGHQTGDRVLCAAVEGIMASTVDGDVVGRVGGDEFVVVLDPSVENVAAVTCRIREQILRHTAQVDPSAGLEASIGVGTRIDGDDFDALIDRADRAMYAEKEHRRAIAQALSDSLAPELERGADARPADTPRPVVEASADDSRALVTP